MADEAIRWERVYRTKEEVETSWFEDRPHMGPESEREAYVV